MRISDIMQCFSNNYKAGRIIKLDFWEDSFFNEKLSQYQGEQNADAIYELLRTEYLKELEENNFHDYRKGEKHRKFINRLSNYLYNDKYYWAKGTKLETRLLELERNRNLRLQRYESIQFLY